MASGYRPPISGSFGRTRGQTANQGPAPGGRLCLSAISSSVTPLLATNTMVTAIRLRRVIVARAVNGGEPDEGVNSTLIGLAGSVTRSKILGLEACRASPVTE